jgi:hypothetical protein
MVLADDADDDDEAGQLLPTAPADGAGAPEPAGSGPGAAAVAQHPAAGPGLADAVHGAPTLLAAVAAAGVPSSLSLRLVSKACCEAVDTAITCITLAFNDAAGGAGAAGEAAWLARMERRLAKLPRLAELTCSGPSDVELGQVLAGPAAAGVQRLKVGGCTSGQRARCEPSGALAPSRALGLALGLAALAPSFEVRSSSGWPTSRSLVSWAVLRGPACVQPSMVALMVLHLEGVRTAGLWGGGGVVVVGFAGPSMYVGGDDHQPPLAFGAQGRMQSLAIGREPQPEPGGEAGPALALKGALAALSHLTRLTSLTVHALGGREECGAPARDVLRSLPPGLKQVGHWLTAPRWLGDKAQRTVVGPHSRGPSAQ